MTPKTLAIVGIVWLHRFKLSVQMGKFRGRDEIHLHRGCFHGCGSVAVSTVGCGPAGPGSSPGHGPKPLPKVLIVDNVSHPFCLSHEIVSILLANPHNQW